MDNNTRFAAIDGGTGGCGAWKHDNGDAAFNAAREAERILAQTPMQRHLDGLVVSVRGTVLRHAGQIHIEAPAVDLYAWADNLARNILAGLVADLKEVA